MRKDNKGQQKTLEVEMFPQALPHPENGGETNKQQIPLGHEPETLFTNPDGTKYVQPSLDTIWKWFGESGETYGETLADDA